MTNTATEGIMPKREMGAGEAAERARARRKWTILGALFAMGLPIGFLAGRLETGESGFFSIGTLPPWFAVLAAAVMLIAVAGGNLYLHRRLDELERQDNRVASAMGANTLLVVYLPWYMLWRGGLLPEPAHEALMTILVAATLSVYLFTKIRQRV